MPIKRPVLLSVVLAGVVATGCDLSPVPDGTPAPTPGIGGTWTVVRIGDVAAVPMDEPHVQFTLGGRVQGETGCSDFDASVRVAGNAFAVGQLGRGYTDPQCPAPQREQEEAFVAVLRTANSIEELGRGRLRVSGPDGEMVLLREGEGNFDVTDEEQAVLTGLRQGPWTILKATGLPDDPPIPPVEFADLVFSAAGPCGLTGNYRLRGEDLVQLHSISPTEGEPCTAPGDLLRTRLAESLAAVTHLEIDAAGRLRLRGRGVEIFLELRSSS